MPTGESINRLLAPARIMKVISQIKKASTPISQLLGFNIGGKNRTPYGGRNFAYDVVNPSRQISTPRTPNQPSARIAPQKVGSVTGVFPRSAETIPMFDEDLFNRRRIGANAAELDDMGEAYITRQEDYLAQRFGNLIEFMSVAMLRGSFSYTTATAGDLLWYDFSGGTSTVDFQVPSGNKSQLNMLGTGSIISASWASASTNIPGHLMAINKAMLQLSGFPLKHILCGSDVWNYCITNTAVIQAGGPNNSPFEKLKQDENGNFEAILRAVPWLRFHIIDTGLEVGSSNTYKTLIEPDSFIGMPDPSSEWCTFLEGSEIVTEGPGVGAPRAERYGFYPFAYPTFDPSGWNLAAVFNGLPALYVPKAVVYADTTIP